METQNLSPVPQAMPQDNFNLREVLFLSKAMSDEDIAKLEPLFAGIIWQYHVKQSTLELKFIQPDSRGYLELFKSLRSLNCLRVGFTDSDYREDVLSVSFRGLEFVSEHRDHDIESHDSAYRVLTFNVAEIEENEC